MKSKILFSTLVMAAAFSACTQEDIAVNNENASMEAVGAKLLASGISVNSGEVANSRVAVENGIPTFTKGDKAAVAWTVKNGSSVSADQNGVAISQLSDNLFANHMLVHDGDKFESRGNVYEGWHFAYRPFQYMARPAQLEVVVNDSTPLVESDLNIDWYLNGPMFSNALFLSDENVDVENGVVTADMPLYFVHNSIRPQLNVDKKFTDDKLLKKIAIKSITLNAGKDNKLFTESFMVSPKGLKDIAAEDAEGNIKNDSINETYFGTAFTDVELDSMVVTTIANSEAYNLGKAQNTVRMFLAPTKSASGVTVEELSFRIDVAGGHFDVAYTPEVNAGGEEVELSKIEIANNNAIKKMLLLLNGEQDDELNRSARDLKKLWVDGANGKKVQTPAQTIPMSLGLENFTADYLIEDSTDWNGCVALANALCEEGEVPTFTLKSGANVIFEDTITTPKNGVKLVGDKANAGKLIINDNLTWNNAVSIERSNKDVIVVVNENKQLDVVEGKLQPYRIYNYGTIFADSLSTIGTKGYNNLYTSNRIEIQYGAYVYPAASGTEGNNIIAYNVPANETAARIKTLIIGGTGTGKANVNTLIIENGVVLDLTPIIGGTTAGDRYNNNTTADDTTYPVLDNVNVELNKGTIKSTAVVNVKDLTLAGEGNTVSNINVLGNLTIEAGTNTIVAESVSGAATIKGGETTITGTTFASNVTVEAGSVTMNNVDITGDLTNKGTVTIAGEATEIANIVNDGTLNANTDIVVETIAVNAKATANVAEEKTIWYTVPLAQGGYVQKGTTTGSINYYGSAQFMVDIANAQPGSTVTINNDIEINSIPAVAEGVTIQGINKDTKFTMNLTSALKFDSKVNFKDLTIEATTTYDDGVSYTGYENYILFTNDANFENVTFNNTIAIAGNSTFKNVTFNGNNEANAYAMWVATHGKIVTIMNSTISAKRGIKVQNDFNSKFGTNVNDVETTELRVSATTFTTLKKSAVLADGAVKVLWNNDNNISAVADDATNAVWVDEAYAANADKVVVTGCTKKIEGQ